MKAGNEAKSEVQVHVIMGVCVGGEEVTAFMVALSSGTDPMDSLTGQPRSPNSELHTQTSAVPTPPTGKLYRVCSISV